MSKTKKILMLVSSILMIVSGLVTGIICFINILQPGRLDTTMSNIFDFNSDNINILRSMFKFYISFLTAGSLVGIVFGAISIRFCFYNSFEFYTRKSVILTIAIICTIVANILVGALYIVAVLIKDDNLNLEDIEFDNTTEAMEKLERLNELKKDGAVNDDEYEVLKADIIKGTTLEEKQ